MCPVDGPSRSERVSSTSMKGPEDMMRRGRGWRSTLTLRRVVEGPADGMIVCDVSLTLSVHARDTAADRAVELDERSFDVAKM